MKLSRQEKLILTGANVLVLLFLLAPSGASLIAAKEDERYHRIAIDSIPIGASLSINDGEFTTPYEADLPEGKYLITLRLEGYETKYDCVDVSEDSRRIFELTSPPMDLAITVIPADLSVEIYVDGERVRQTSSGQFRHSVSPTESHVIAAWAEGRRWARGTVPANPDLTGAERQFPVTLELKQIGIGDLRDYYVWPGCSVRFSAPASATDLTYIWSVEDVPVCEQAAFNHPFPDPGVYRVSLTGTPPQEDFESVESAEKSTKSTSCLCHVSDCYKMSDPGRDASPPWIDLFAVQLGFFPVYSGDAGYEARVFFHLASAPPEKPEQNFVGYRVELTSQRSGQYLYHAASLTWRRDGADPKKPGAWTTTWLTGRGEQRIPEPPEIVTLPRNGGVIQVTIPVSASFNPAELVAWQVFAETISPDPTLEGFEETHEVKCLACREGQ